MHANVAPAPHSRGIGTVFTVAGIFAITVATGLPGSGTPMHSHLCLVCGPLGGVDTILNILLFVPFGAGLALRGVRWNRAVLTVCAVSVVIESAQLFLIPGRDATIGDVVTNTVGGALGFGLASNSTKLLRPSAPLATVLGLGWCATWIAVQWVSYLAFVPTIPPSSHYGQLGRELGNFEVFPGRVLKASLDSRPIGDTVLDPRDSVARRLVDGGEVAATVLPSTLTRSLAPIVRVVDKDQREALLLAQDGPDLIFGVRTGATVLRLRPPLFALSSSFRDIRRPEGVSGDTLTLRGAYSPRAVTLSAVRPPSGTRRMQLYPTAALGWTLVLPAQWYIEGTGTERLVSWIWLALLAAPLGYWATRALLAPSDTSPTHAAIWAAALLLLVAWLAVAPRVFGLRPTVLSEWLASFGGVLIGVILSRRGLAGGGSGTRGTRRLGGAVV